VKKLKAGRSRFTSDNVGLYPASSGWINVVLGTCNGGGPQLFGSSGEKEKKQLTFQGK